MTNPKVDFFFDKETQWQDAYIELRRIVLDCQPTDSTEDWREELKWGHPCYTFKGKNVVLIHGFKEYCALLFHKGVLLNDPEGILVQQTENVQAARQIRFSSLDDVMELESVLKSYIKNAIEIEDKGLQVELKKKSEYKMPEEFEQVLNEDAELKAAFEALTPGRQRAYLLHFSQPKQSKTRVSRIEKCIPAMMEGKGLNDR
ncbi:YdeI/OmpD-associated family protein [Reichenbachiella ulvae]|uniref:YdeI/OmpD-associated family protein n=1 Tax=Reichenbachiella ulvae TaxID=2980104 RepID=A0ABT3CWJ4_9BACT|nr:DUF1801 domain-containing protein [Reichenbachiella ulvae]MCV9387598.1 YdeI/OmpD-associated family protein [Reichenbachiella ulvae]